MPPRLNSQHTTYPQGHRGAPEEGLHGCSRAGGNCSFPCCNLARRGPGVSPVCVAKSHKEAVSPAGCAGAKPPPSRKTFSLGECVVWTACPTVFPACRSFVSYRPFCIACVRRKNRGPRATGRVAAGAALPLTMTACARTAAVLHRLASPICASSWTRIVVPSGATVPQVRSRCATGAFGRMPQVGRLVHPGANVRCLQAGRF